MKNFLDEHPQDWVNNPEYEELRTLLVYMAEGGDGIQSLRDLALESGISAGTFPERDNVGATCHDLIERMGLQGKLRKLVEVASTRPTVHAPRLREMLTLPARPAPDAAGAVQAQQPPGPPDEAVPPDTSPPSPVPSTPPEAVDLPPESRPPAEDEPNLDGTRELLRAVFGGAEEVRTFCEQRPKLQPIVHKFAPDRELDDIFEEVLDFCRTQQLWRHFLLEVRNEVPCVYHEHRHKLGEPYSFDVFLNCSDMDVEPVERLAEKLEDEQCVGVWFGGWHLVPGERVSGDMPPGLYLADSCAICVGEQTPSDWFKAEEVRALERRETAGGLPRVMGVLLPGAQLPDDEQEERDESPKIGTWIDLRREEDEEHFAVQFHRLVSGIWGRAPGRWGRALTGKGRPSPDSGEQRVGGQREGLPKKKKKKKSGRKAKDKQTKAK